MVYKFLNLRYNTQKRIKQPYHSHDRARRDTMAAVVKKDWGRIEVTDGVIAKLAG